MVTTGIMTMVGIAGLAVASSYIEDILEEKGKQKLCKYVRMGLHITIGLITYTYVADGMVRIYQDFTSIGRRLW